jgi:hypothetical protein
MSKVFYTSTLPHCDSSGVTNAQENAMSISRRSLVTTAAVLPALAVPAASALAAGEAGEDAKLRRLGDEVRSAYEALGLVLDALAVAERRLFQWRHANPEPDKESAAWIEWPKREAAFKRACGYDEARAAGDEANDKLDDAIDAACETPARTMRGLIAKARIGEIDPEVVGQYVAQSIIDDLLALDAGHV